MNTTIRFFQSKQQYLNFRTAFAAAVNDKQCRKSYTDNTGTRWNDKTQAKETYAYRTKRSGWLSSTHYLLFNLACGKNYYNGFSPKTKESFVTSGGCADRGLNTALYELEVQIDNAKMLIGQKEIVVPSYFKNIKEFKSERMAKMQNTVNAFLLPFSGVFTIEDLARVQLPMFPRLSTEQIKEKVTYKQAFGPQITDQTPPSVMIAADVAIVEILIPTVEKKGFFSRMFS